MNAHLRYRLKHYLRRFQSLKYSLLHLSEHKAKSDVGDIYVFIRCWNRPLYLWACLDNLFRITPSDVKFILIDNASDDPLVKDVIRGFERRGMFHAVHMMDSNHTRNQEFVFFKYRDNLGKYFFLVDADITIHCDKGPWTGVFIDSAERHHQMGIIGSYIDKSDFISFEDAKRLVPEEPDATITELIKGNSIERKIPPRHSELINPFRPPGRLLLLRSSLFLQSGLPIGNKSLCEVVKAQGYDYSISTRVIHRHLSLLNIFDYPEYDIERLKKYLSGQ